MTGDSGGDTTVQNIFVNVKGNKNIIVVTQALQGEANVNVQAIKASGNADVDAEQNCHAKQHAHGDADSDHHSNAQQHAHI